MSQVKVTVMPMIGEVKEERLHSLSGCHAIFERQVVKVPKSGGFAEAVVESVKELMLADRHAALSGKLQFVVTVEVK